MNPKTKLIVFNVFFYVRTTKQPSLRAVFLNLAMFLDTTLSTFWTTIWGTEPWYQLGIIIFTIHDTLSSKNNCLPRYN